MLSSSETRTKVFFWPLGKQNQRGAPRSVNPAIFSLPPPPSPPSLSEHRVSELLQRIHLWATPGPFLALLSESLSTSVCRLAATSDVGDQPWKFYFKLYCFLDTDNVPKDSVEFAFMFEQVNGALWFLCRRARVKPIHRPRTILPVRT